jgi:hypothetical protein
VAEHFDPTTEGTEVAQQLPPPATEHDLRTTTHPLIE